MIELQIGDAFLFNNGHAFGCIIAINKEKGICLIKFQNSDFKDMEVPTEIVKQYLMKEGN